MEGAAVMSTPSNSRFRSHLKTAAGALCRAGSAAAAAGTARTLPKRHVSKPVAAQHHHTFPKVASHRTTISKHLATLFRDIPFRAVAAAPLVTAASTAAADPTHTDESELKFSNAFDASDHSNGLHKLKGNMAREVASAWSHRVGSPDQAAPADRVQGLFNELHLYPTKTQVFEMLVCARQCTRRKSLSLTFGEFCVFAAELRKCARKAKQISSKADSPHWPDPPPPSLREKEPQRSPRVNGSEASPPPALPPPYEVFLGGSCNPTTWRAEIAIPLLEEMGITYFNPQVAEWSLELVEVENRAKQAARALLFVLDCETRAVAASVEAAQLAALPRDLLLVLRPYRRGQRICGEPLSDQEYVELSRARAALQEAVERRGLPAFTDIPSALRCARTVLRGARTLPRQPLGHTILRLKRAFDAAGARAARLSRVRAAHAAADLARVSRDEALVAFPPSDHVDFESFCAAVADLTADQDMRAELQRPEAEAARGGGGVAARVRRLLSSLRARVTRPGGGAEATSGTDTGRTNGAAPPPPPPPPPVVNGVAPAAADVVNGCERVRLSHSSRLKACGKKLTLFIPKGGGGGGGSAGSAESGADGGGRPAAARSPFTPGTERRLERLPDMLAASPAPAPPSPAAPAPAHAQYVYDVYLGGSLPKNEWLEERLRATGLTCVVPRLNDYTRMFSAPARRAAPAHPDSPRADKKPRVAPPSPVQLREGGGAGGGAGAGAADRLSASDFYTVSDDHTPQPFKGTYDEELMWRSRALLFSISSDAPCFAAMVLAAHHMELRPAATVLLVQTLRPAAHLSETAVKDYNRGRHYLKDLAQRAGVAVVDSAEDALARLAAVLAAPSPPPPSSPTHNSTY